MALLPPTPPRGHAAADTPPQCASRCRHSVFAHSPPPRPLLVTARHCRGEPGGRERGDTAIASPAARRGFPHPTSAARGVPQLTSLHRKGGSRHDVRGPGGAAGSRFVGGGGGLSGVRPRELSLYLSASPAPGAQQHGAAAGGRGGREGGRCLPPPRPLRPPRPGWSRPPPGGAVRSRCLWETKGAGMAQPSAPPAYDDKNPLYPPPPAGYPQPSHYGGYPQPGGYPAAGGYAQPGGYPVAGGYPQPGLAMPTMPMRFGDNGMGDGSPFQSADWDDRKVRHTFIRKVYAIISLQLLVTVGIIAVFTFVHPVRSFVQRNVAIYYASYAVFLVTYLVLACCQGPRRRFPWNIILLSIFTLAMGLMTGTIASMYRTNAVLIAMLITAIVAIVVTIFCFQTKVDFTSCPGLFCVLGIVVMVTGIVTAIVLSFKYVPWLHMLYAAIGAIAFTLFLAYDTQLVLGNRKNTLSPEEYIYGALTIYTDIIYIFTFILQIVGRD